MRKFRFNKLVRDKIPANQIADGAKVKYRKLSRKEHIAALKLKLQEELQELLAETDNEKLIEELADVQEVVDNLIKLLTNKQQLRRIQNAKKRKSGSFIEGLFMEEIIVPSDFPTLQHFLDNPDRYPEITDNQ